MAGRASNRAKIVEPMTAQRGEPCRLQEPERRKRQPHRAPVHEQVNEERRREGDEPQDWKPPRHEAHESIHMNEFAAWVLRGEGSRSFSLRSRKLRSARSGGVSVTISEY